MSHSRYSRRYECFESNLEPKERWDWRAKWIYFTGHDPAASWEIVFWFYLFTAAKLFFLVLSNLSPPLKILNLYFFAPPHETLVAGGVVSDYLPVPLRLPLSLRLKLLEGKSSDWAQTSTMKWVDLEVKGQRWRSLWSWRPTAVVWWVKVSLRTLRCFWWSQQSVRKDFLFPVLFTNRFVTYSFEYVFKTNRWFHPN